MRSHPKLIHVCFPRNDGARIAELPDDRRIVRTREVLEDARSSRGREIGSANVIFDAYESASYVVFRKSVNPRERYLLGSLYASEGYGAIVERDEGIEEAVSRLIRYVFFGMVEEGHGGWKASQSRVAERIEVSSEIGELRRKAIATSGDGHK